LIEDISGNFNQKTQSCFIQSDEKWVKIITTPDEKVCFRYRSDSEYYLVYDINYLNINGIGVKCRR